MHHQKCVLVDTQDVGNNCKVTAFIGGIDLCDGRYDTPDLETVFKDDFHNPTFPLGRIMTKRSSSSNLFFYELQSDDFKVKVMADGT
ncbi:unnamed protein product [Arabidopsis lyrata]|nr:unnamed protein product [Arabidopsis lyrata]